MDNVDFYTVVKLVKVVRKTPNGIGIKQLEVKSSMHEYPVELLFAYLLQGMTPQTPGAEVRALVDSRLTRDALVAVAEKHPDFRSKIDLLLEYDSKLCAAATNLVVAPAAYYERMMERLDANITYHRYISHLYLQELVCDFAMGLPALEYLYFKGFRMYGSPRLAGVLQHPSLRQVLVSQPNEYFESTIAQAFLGFPPGAAVAYTSEPWYELQLLLDVAQKRMFAGATTGVDDISLDYNVSYDNKPVVKEFGRAEFAGWI